MRLVAHKRLRSFSSGAWVAASAHVLNGKLYNIAEVAAVEITDTPRIVTQELVKARPLPPQLLSRDKAR